MTLLTAEFRRELPRLLVTLEQDLLHQAQFARNPTLQAGHMEALRKLENHHEEFISIFLRRLADGLCNIRTPSSRPRPGAPSFSMEGLRLVDDTEISEDAVLRSIAERHAGSARLPLLLLGQRFGVMAGAPAFDGESLPVGPWRLGQLLSDAATALELNLDTRLKLYRLFESQFAPDYAALVESMNALLAGAHVLPGLTYVPLRKRRRPVEAATPRPRAETGEDTGDASTASAPASTAPFTSWPGSQPPGGGSAADDVGMLALLKELLAERRAESGRQPAPTDTATPRVTLPSGDVDAALGAMQARVREKATPPRLPEIRQALLVQARLQSGQATTLSPEDEDTFELLGLLHSGMRQELGDQGPATELVDRLQVPVLRAALQDQTFFVRQQHPARQLLSAVAEAGSNWATGEDSDPQLTAQLKDTVEEVVSHYDGDARVFETAHHKLQQHLQRMARRAEVSERRQVEGARGREKLELARQAAVEAVDVATGDASVPRFIRTLLEQPWTDALTLVLLRHGNESPEWNAHVEATHHIVQSAVHGAPAPDGLRARIRQALGPVGYSGEDAEAVVRALTGGIDESDDPASRTELAMKLKGRARLGAAPAAASGDAPVAPRSPKEQECYQHLCTLPFGTWFEFDQPDGTILRQRLAWFSPRTGHALFVNQRGQRVEEGHGRHDLDQVARQVSAGRARVLTTDRAGLVDRAWQSALSSLRNLSGRKGRPGGQA